MQSVNVVSRAKFHVISKGVFGLALSLILCTGKWIELVIETLVAFNLYFQPIGLNLHENQAQHSKDCKGHLPFCTGNRPQIDFHENLHTHRF
jgi:hypothetical protein